MKLSNIGFDELCNTLEKKYASYRNKQLEIADNPVFAVNPPSNSKLDHSCYIFLVVLRNNKEISPSLYIILFKLTNLKFSSRIRTSFLTFIYILSKTVKVSRAIAKNHLSIDSLI